MDKVTENPRNEKATDFHINVGKNTSIVGGSFFSGRKFTDAGSINPVPPNTISLGNYSSYTFFGSVPISDSVGFLIDAVGTWELDVTFSVEVHGGSKNRKNLIG